VIILDNFVLGCTSVIIFGFNITTFIAYYNDNKYVLRVSTRPCRLQACKQIYFCNSLVLMREEVGWTIRDSNPARSRIFFCAPKGPDRLRSPSTHLFNGCRNFFPEGRGVKRPGREVDRSPLMLRLRMSGGGRSLPLYASMVCIGTLKLVLIHEEVI